MTERPMIDIQVKNYLKAFLVNVYGKGKEPIYFPKKDPLNRFLNAALIKRPLNARIKKYDPDTSITLILPYFEWHSPVVYNYLTEKAELEFADKLEDHFFVTYTTYCNKLFLDGVSVSLVPHLFICHYELPDDLAFESRLRKYLYRNQYKNVKAPIRSYKFHND